MRWLSAMLHPGKSDETASALTSHIRAHMLAPNTALAATGSTFWEPSRAVSSKYGLCQIGGSPAFIVDGGTCSHVQPDPACDTTAQTGQSARYPRRKIPPCRQFTLASDSIRSGSHADLTDAHIPRRNPSRFFATVLENCKDATITDGD